MRHLLVIVSIWFIISAASFVAPAHYTARIVPATTTTYLEAGHTSVTLDVNVTAIEDAEDVPIQTFWSCPNADLLDVSAVAVIPKGRHCRHSSVPGSLLCSSATSAQFSLANINVNLTAFGTAIEPLSIIADCFRLRVGDADAAPAPESADETDAAALALSLPPPVTAFTVTRAATSLVPVIRSPFDAAIDVALDVAFTLPYAAGAYTEFAIVLGPDSGLTLRAHNGTGESSSAGSRGVQMGFVSGNAEDFLDSCLTKRVSDRRLNLRCLGLTAGEWVFRLDPVTATPAAAAHSAGGSHGSLSVLPANAVALVLNNKLTFFNSASDDGTVALTEFPALFEDDKVDTDTTSSFVALNRGAARLTVYTAALTTDAAADARADDSAATRAVHVQLARNMRLPNCKAFEFTPALALTTVADAATKAGTSPFLRPVCREARVVDYGAAAAFTCDVPLAAAATMLAVALSGVRDHSHYDTDGNGSDEDDVGACFDVSVTVAAASLLANSRIAARGARGMGMKTQSSAQAQAEARMIAMYPLYIEECQLESEQTVVNMKTTAV